MPTQHIKIQMNANKTKIASLEVEHDTSKEHTIPYIRCDLRLVI